MKKNHVPVRVGGSHPENPLQQVRIIARVSQEQIAEVLSCDSRTIQHYESDEQFPTQDMLLKMRDYYACDFADLFPRNEA